MAFNIANIYDIYEVSKDERDILSLADDKFLKLQIQAFLASENLKNLFNISVESFNKNVFLIGEYEDEYAREVLTSYVENLSKINTLTTYIYPKRLKSKCSISQQLQMKTTLKFNLINERNINSTNIHIHVVKCDIVLVGIVTNINEINIAKNQAKNIQGVQKVQSYLFFY